MIFRRSKLLKRSRSWNEKNSPSNRRRQERGKDGGEDVEVDDNYAEVEVEGVKEAGKALRALVLSHWL